MRKCSFFNSTHIDVPSAFQIASEITFARVELRRQAGSDGGGGALQPSPHCKRFVVFDSLRQPLNAAD